MTIEDEKKPGVATKLAASVAGVASALYLLPIPLPFVSWLDNILAIGVLGWSIHTLGLHPLDLLRARKERKQLEAAKRELGAEPDTP